VNEKELIKKLETRRTLMTLDEFFTEYKEAARDYKPYLSLNGIRFIHEQFKDLHFCPINIVFRKKTGVEASPVWAYDQGDRLGLTKGDVRDIIHASDDEGYTGNMRERLLEVFRKDS
jgi:hypothetical protein